VPDTGGPGKFRGGLSLIREYRTLAEETLLTIRSDKRRFPPHGLFGGKPGSPSWNILNPGPEERVLPVLLTQPVIMGKGDVYRHIMAGGGGYGPPDERDPEMILREVKEEKTTIEHAREAYGVVIRMDQNEPAIDLTATEQLRNTMREARKKS
jgi:N-methylhydantoinase B